MKLSVERSPQNTPVQKKTEAIRSYDSNYISECTTCTKLSDK